MRCRASARTRFSSVAVPGSGHDRAVRLELLLGARVDDAVEPVGPERVADRAEQLDRQLAVAIGELAAAFRRRRTHSSGDRPRPACVARQRPSLDETPFDEDVDVLADGRLGDPERLGHFGRGGAVAAFEVFEHPLLRGAQGLGHAPILRLPQALT